MEYALFYIGGIMYKIVKYLSFLIRQFFLPNPFINIFNATTAEIINVMVGGIFIPLAYILTGTWYISSKETAWIGSIGFLINYAILTLLLLLISYLIENIYLIVIVYMVAYVLLCIIEHKLFNKNSKRMFI